MTSENVGDAIIESVATRKLDFARSGAQHPMRGTTDPAKASSARSDLFHERSWSGKDL
jgi:hypothetical protein